MKKEKIMQMIQAYDGLNLYMTTDMEPDKVLWTV